MKRSATDTNGTDNPKRHHEVAFCGLLDDWITYYYESPSTTIPVFRDSRIHKKGESMRHLFFLNEPNLLKPRLQAKTIFTENLGRMGGNLHIVANIEPKSPHFRWFLTLQIGNWCRNISSTICCKLSQNTLHRGADSRNSVVLNKTH